MCCILELFREEVTGVDNSRNVSNFGHTTLMAFTNIVFTKIDVFGAFVCARCGPIYGRFVIVVDSNAPECIGHVQILGAKEDTV
jgi:hypothetical protein